MFSVSTCNNTVLVSYCCKSRYPESFKRIKELNVTGAP